MEGFAQKFAWMAWTWQTGAFFTTIVVILIGMGIWERVSPSGERVGILRLSTTRGDRLFISLLGAAYIHLAWLGILGQGVPLYWATAIAFVYALGVFRWV